MAKHFSLEKRRSTLFHKYSSLFNVQESAAQNRESACIRLFPWDSLASFFSDTAEYIPLPTAQLLTADESELTRATLLCMFRKMSSATEERRGETDMILAQVLSSKWRVVNPRPLTDCLHPAAGCINADTQSYFIYAACLLQTYALMQILIEPRCAPCWKSNTKKT